MAVNGADVNKSPVQSIVDILAANPDATDDTDATVDLTNDGSKIDDVNTEVNELDTKDDNESADVTSEEVEIDSSTLASLLGIDESDIKIGEDGSPLFKAKVDGKEQEISFNSLLRSYRLQQHVDEKAKEVNSQKEAVAAEVKQLRDNYQVAIQQAALMITAQEEELIAEFNSVDWDKVKESNPNQYIIKRDEYKERFNKLQSKRMSLGEKWDADQQKANAEISERLNNQLSKEAELIVEKIPEWKDSETAKREALEIKAYAISQGFSEKELSTLIDHRAWVMLRKANLYDQLSNKTNTTVKKITTLPKIVQKKTSGDPDASQKGKVAKLRKAAIDGKEAQKIAYVSELLKGKV